MSRATSLVSTDWVLENLTNKSVVFVEVDEDTTLYEKGHIDGAITFHWREDLQDGLIRDLISKEKFEALLSKNGISNDSTVVLYGGNNNWFATYAFWYFKIYGHADVRLIDGGRKLWELKGLPLVTEVRTRIPSRYIAKERDNSIRAFRDQVISSIGIKNIVDVRSPAEFSGELAAPAHLPQEGGQIKGHIPSAKNIPWSKAANEDGTFRSNEELAELYKAAGVDFAKETIAYCRIGERSAFSWFVLHELLDLQNVTNYDGSWTEYGSLVGVPVAVGA
ncbi:MAG: sulfurtransferase [Actinobacteria bacterium]|nr:sulfurtransferase [Actinomycetota bacterium]MDA2981876.1 sulfurtransferase [Actinomycetota bacterium]MDA2997207.1 sulfurtransferase [Actinomycetota bacterium]